MGGSAKVNTERRKILVGIFETKTETEKRTKEKESSRLYKVEWMTYTCAGHFFCRF